MAGLNPLVDKIRAAHPGAYDDMNDAELTKRVLAKYPQYSDLAAPGVNRPSLPEGLGPSSFAERAGQRFKENVYAPAKMLDAIPDAVSAGLQQASQGRFQMTDKGKAQLYPFGTSPLAKAAGIATVAQRQVYGMGKDIVQSWMADPANAVGDVAAAALPMADAKIPANAEFSAGARTGIPPAAQEMLTNFVKRKISREVPVLGKGLRAFDALKELQSMFEQAKTAPAGTMPAGLPERGGFPLPTRSAPTPSPTTPPPVAEPEMEMLRRAGTPRPDAAELGINQVPVAQRASTIIPQEEQAAIAARVEGRGASKAAIESTLTPAGAAADQSALKQVQAERPDWTLSQQLQEAAKRMKTARAPFPPEATRTALDIKGNAFKDVQNDASLLDQLRSNLESHGRNAAMEQGRITRAASTVDIPKGTLTNQPAGTVKYTTTPPLPAKKGTVPKNSAEMMRLLKESVKQAKARKK